MFKYDWQFIFEVLNYIVEAELGFFLVACSAITYSFTNFCFYSC